MNILFQQINNSNNTLSWYTWTDELKIKLSSIAEELSSINTEIINLLPNDTYGASYKCKNKTLTKKTKDAVKFISNNLIKLEPKNGIFLFKNLIFENFSSKSLHVLFSLISEELRRTKKMKALHSPIVENIIDEGFPVHADLFETKTLFNVITSIEKNKHGEILLLSIEDLEKAMQSVPKLPINTKDKILDILRNKNGVDLFDNIFYLMYGDHPWSNDLKREIEKRQLWLTPEEGIGYLVIDGQWLHGRNKYLGEIKENRLNRLLFDTNTTKNITEIKYKYSNLETSCETFMKSKKSKSIKSKSLSL